MCFAQVIDDLRRQDDDGLCVIAMSVETWHVWKAYSFLRKLWFTLRQQHREAESAVRVIMEILIARHLTVTPGDLRACEDYNQLLREIETPVERHSLRLPSQGPPPPRDLFHFHNAAGFMYGTLTVSFFWLREPPAYPGDVRTYVEQPLQHRPRLEWIRMLMLEPSGDRRRNVVLSTSSGLLQRVANTREAMGQDLSHMAGAGLEVQAVWLFCAVYMCMVADLTHCAETASRYVDQMTVLGRNSPSGWKIKYLLHLQECLFTLSRQAHLSVTTGRQLVRPPASVPDDLHFVLVEFDRILRDVDFLEGELANIARSIDITTKLVKEQIELSQSFWSTILAFVVAVYVPLSFASVSLMA